MKQVIFQWLDFFLQFKCLLHLKQLRHESAWDISGFDECHDTSLMFQEKSCALELALAVAKETFGFRGQVFFCYVSNAECFNIN